jgi:purine catabolism regulator
VKVSDALGLESLHRARVVAGSSGLEREVQWAHVIDMPDPAPWVRPGQLLLTTGFSWPTTPSETRDLVRLLDQRGLAAVALAVPGYLKHFSDAARSEAERLALPLIEIPFDIPFAQITEELHRAILAEQYRIVERSEQIHRALTRAAAEGSNLTDLARALGQLLNRSVTFEDPSGKLLAFFDAGTGQDEIRRQTLEEQQSPAHLLEALEASGQAEEIRASLGPVRVPAMPDLGLEARVVCPIRLASQLVGLVWIIEGDEPLSELDVRAAEHAALVAALHIAHQRELAMTEARLGYASFLSLLEGKDDDPQALERARLLGFDPDGRHRVGMCVIDEPLPLTREGFLRREHMASQLARALRAAGARPLLTASLNYVTFLLPDGIDPHALWSSLGDPSVRMVLGRAGSGPEAARRSYREAQQVAAYAGGPGVQTFEGSLVPRVLQGDPAAQAEFIDSIFGRVRSRRDGANLERALLTLAKNGFSLKATADSLAIHQNTLRYRLAKASDVLGLDLADPEVRFQLQLAAKILEFVHKK